MSERIKAFIRNLDSSQYNKTQLAADAVRVLGPAALGYFAGYGAEIAATAACGPGLGPMLVGGIVRTHIPGIYQLDIHRPMVNWLREKCGLNEEEFRALLVNDDDIIATQPGAIAESGIVATQPSAADLNTQPAVPFKEKAGACCEKMLTRGLPTMMTGFALGSMPAVLGAPTEVAKYLGNGLQACAPSFFGSLTSQRDARTEAALKATTPGLGQ